MGNLLISIIPPLNVTILFLNESTLGYLKTTHDLQNYSLPPILTLPPHFLPLLLPSPHQHPTSGRVIFTITVMISMTVMKILIIKIAIIMIIIQQ